ncbi:efflux RND transporter permease subunit [Pseudalkalibacillus berkeleyi]|uniref:Efflux RND transporter permease subunit n=1 Tax=Pseudalkalibacillus berkeleyi TaxID=1069813 RepID=A0ABS9H1A1_9BACL|nr:efflux RND transporter permease subunit [Pseudalkalibacillus berkeleyi]MCF6137676.1 efflux RND transporter permease subunit [Pseudalkalibacillus berkeleyi]
MSFLTRFSLKNPFAVIIIGALLVVGGIYSFTNLKVDLLPDIEFPQMSVQVVYPGASTQDVNEKVTDPLEEQLKSLNDVKKVQSQSFESISVINLEFPFSTNLDDIEREIESMIEDADLPENAKPEVNRFSFGTFPIYNISLFPSGDEENFKAFVENELVPEMNKISGVNNISVGGLEDESIVITVDKDKAKQSGLNLNQIKEVINQHYMSFPAGSIEQDTLSIPVRVEEKIETIEQLKALQLDSNQGSQQQGPLSTEESAPTNTSQSTTLGDIAKVEAAADSDEITRYNMNEALSAAITKKQGANTVEVSEKVISTLEKYDDKIDYAIGFDQASGIEQSVEKLVKEGLFGALFASLAVLLFLRNIRATIIAIISIPLSLLIGAIFLAQLGITLNIMTLGGMAVAVGRVVDDSIVVIENISRRLRKSDGTEDKNKLILSSTKEILKAIVSSTLTTVVVFLPLGFVGGVTGEFFLPFALTIVFALLASLIVAVTIVPILAKVSFKKVNSEEKVTWLQKVYVNLIKKSLNHKAVVIILSFVLLGGSFFLTSQLGFVFLPNEQQKTLIASVEMPSSTTLENTNEVSLEVEEFFDGQDDIKDVTAAVGSRDFQSGLKRENVANYFINLKEDADVTAVIDTLENEMKAIVTAESDEAVVSVQELQSGGPPTNNAVNIDLYSNDLEKLQEAASEVEAYMKKNDELDYVSNNFSEKQPQWKVNIDPEVASEYGVSGYMILGIISEQTKPVNIGNLPINGEDSSVTVQYDKKLKSLNELEDLQIFTNKGPVALSDIAEVKRVEDVSSIQKLDGKIFARVSAQILGQNIQKVSSDVINGVKSDVDLPEGVSLEGGGGSDETTETFQQLGLAMLVAIGLVYLTMLITFGKARIPFIILSSLIFVPIGSIGGLWLADEPLSISAMIGVLMLIGIVTTNAIVLVDRIGQNRFEKGMMIREALLEAGKTRLRPILMTAFATIAALLPLAFTTSTGTLISKGLAIVVIGGLTTSTFLTLIIVPVIYELFFFKQARKERKQELNA